MGCRSPAKLVTWYGIRACLPPAKRWQPTNPEGRGEWGQTRPSGPAQGCQGTRAENRLSPARLPLAVLGDCGSSEFRKGFCWRWALCALGGQTAQTCVLTVLEAESRRSRWRPRLSLLGVGAATFALGPHLVISLLVYVQVSPFYRDPSQVGIGPSLVTSF